MKQSLLLLTALAALSASAETFDFSYARGPEHATNVRVSALGTARAYVMFEMSAADIKTYAGSKVTGFTVYSPTNQSETSNPVTSGRFFYTTDKTKEEYTQDFSYAEEVYAKNDVAIDTPYTITGDEQYLAFGYSVVPTSSNEYYIIADGLGKGRTLGLRGVSEDGVSFPSSFESFVSTYGALCMAVTLESESIPVLASFEATPVTTIVGLGENRTKTLSLKVSSAQPIETVDITFSIAGKEYDAVCRPDSVIPGGVPRYFDVDLQLPALSEKMKETVTFRIAKVNGKEIASEAAVSMNLIVTDNLPVHQTLYEEYTGTWCSFCPRGYAALEHIRNNYPEFVTASFHSGSGSGSKDPMQVTYSFPYSVGNFPGATINRQTLVDPYYGSEKYNSLVPVIDDIIAANNSLTYWRVSADHQWANDSTLVAKATVSHVSGFTDKTYKIAYLLVADGLKGKTSGWVQKNSYYADAPVYCDELNDFCRGGSHASGTVIGLEFNDVVVSPDGIKGVAESIPTSLDADVEVEHSFSFDLSKISADMIPDKTKLRVIAAVVDSRGVVMNCAKNEVNDYEGASVDAVSVDPEAPVEYFNLSGQRVLNPVGGIFIRRQGSSATKVIR